LQSNCCRFAISELVYESLMIEIKKQDRVLR
jgi:hypothetical protein